MMNPKDMALNIAHILDDKGARDISVLEIGHLSSIADYMVVCTGRNSPAVQALSRDLDDKMFEKGVDVRRREGVNEARWIVMDYDCVIVHIFHPEEREYYNIDRLWMDGSNAVNFESAYADE